MDSSPVTTGSLHQLRALEINPASWSGCPEAALLAHDCCCLRELGLWARFAASGAAPGEMAVGRSARAAGLAETRLVQGSAAGASGDASEVLVGQG